MYTKFYIKDKNSLDAQTLFVSPENRNFPTAASIKSPVFNEFFAWKTRAGGNFVESFNHRSRPSVKLCFTARFAARQNVDSGAPQNL